MTKFIDLSTTTHRGKRKTIITHVFNTSQGWIKCHKVVSDYENVAFIGEDSVYGEMFKIWDNKTPNSFLICKGIKGDEFNS